MIDHLKNNFFFYFLLLLTPIILFFLSKNEIHSGATLCLFNNLFGIECYGCGTYRAILSLLNTELTNAINYNVNILYISLILIYLWIKKIFSYN